MLFNEAEMLKICEKYGIEVVEKEGYPLDMDQEMDENFSVEMIMREPIIEKNIIISSECISLSLPIYHEDMLVVNSYYSNLECNDRIYFPKLEVDIKMSSSISYNNENKLAA